MSHPIERMAAPEAAPANLRGSPSDDRRSPASEACEYGDRADPLSNDDEEKLFRPEEG